MNQFESETFFVLGKFVYTTKLMEKVTRKIKTIDVSFGE